MMTQDGRHFLRALRWCDLNFSIKSARSPKGRVEAVDVICRGDHHYAAAPHPDAINHKENARQNRRPPIATTIGKCLAVRKRIKFIDEKKLPELRPLPDRRRAAQL